MKRSLLIASLSALLLALFALPLAAEPIVPISGEAVPDEEIPPPATPVTSYEACVAEALDPTTCDGVPVVPPAEPCPAEGCGAIDTVPEESQVKQAALMAAEDAASEAVADLVAEEGPDAVDSAAAYMTALGAAREAARETGVDEGTAEALAETAAIGAVAREAASDAIAGDEGSGAVDGTTAYLDALGGVIREADTSEESAPIAPGRAAATRSDEETPDSEKAGSAGDETGDTRDQVASDEEPSDAGIEASEDEASSAEGGVSTAGEEEPFEAVATALPAAEDASPVVLGAGALLAVAGIVGLLIRRRLALQGSHEPEQQSGEEEASEEPSAVRRLPHRSVR
ncbi:MAG: hypothetical protein M3N45_02750 [Actinomycetota bacterium]|nr:hypothetical protein [Actinomycetota bacterium]